MDKFRLFGLTTPDCKSFIKRSFYRTVRLLRGKTWLRRFHRLARRITAILKSERGLSLKSVSCSIAPQTPNSARFRRLYTAANKCASPQLTDSLGARIRPKPIHCTERAVAQQTRCSPVQTTQPPGTPPICARVTGRHTRHENHARLWG